MQTVNMKGAVMIGKVLLFIGCLLLAGCQPKGEGNAGEQQMGHRLFQHQEQGWKSKTRGHFVNDITYRATQVPIDYYLLKQLGTDEMEKMDSIYKQSEGERIIEFEFEGIEGQDLLGSPYTELPYDKGVEYLASGIAKDFKVVTQARDTVDCSGVLFERHFKVSPFKRVLLYFNGVPVGEPVQLIYRDRLFNNGIFKFKFEEAPFQT